MTIFAMKKIKFTLLILGFISYGITVNAQSSITIDASQQMTNFVFVDGTGIQENTFMMFT